MAIQQQVLTGGFTAITLGNLDTARSSDEFVAAYSGTISQIELDLRVSIGSTVNLILSIHADNSGLPGTVLATSTISSSTYADSVRKWIPFTFSAFPIVLGTKYFISLRKSATELIGIIWYKGATTPSYNYQSYTSTNSGGSWTTNTEDYAWMITIQPSTTPLNRLVYASGQVVFDGATSESSSRTDADSTLQSSINSEASARVSSDSTLQSNLSSEISSRVASDSTLTSAINQEVTARSDADSTLQSTIDSLSTTTWVYSSTAAENRNATAPCQVMACLTSTPITITLPPTDMSSAGKKVRILDAKGSAATNNITVARNGSNIAGLAEDFIIDTNWSNILFLYVDSTIGWAPTR
jgi:hypothetical protein